MQIEQVYKLRNYIKNLVSISGIYRPIYHKGSHLLFFVKRKLQSFEILDKRLHLLSGTLQ